MIASRHCMNGILAAVVSASFAPPVAYAKEAKAQTVQGKPKAAAKKPAHATAKPATDSPKSENAAPAGASEAK